MWPQMLWPHHSLHYPYGILSSSHSVFFRKYHLQIRTAVTGRTMAGARARPVCRREHRRGAGVAGARDRVGEAAADVRQRAGGQAGDPVDDRGF